jgi:hypothetical protein
MTVMTLVMFSSIIINKETPSQTKEISSKNPQDQLSGQTPSGASDELAIQQ